MTEKKTKFKDEIEDLNKEVQEFEKEKERVRNIIGTIGGIPTFNTKLFNVVFGVLITTFLVVSLISKGTLRLAMIELATASISAKLIYLIHNQARVNHLVLWILSSLEWRITEIQKLLKDIKNIS